MIALNMMSLEVRLQWVGVPLSGRGVGLVVIFTFIASNPGLSNRRGFEARWMLQ